MSFEEGTQRRRSSWFRIAFTLTACAGWSLPAPLAGDIAAAALVFQTLTLLLQSQKDGALPNGSGSFAAPTSSGSRIHAKSAKPLAAGASAAGAGPASPSSSFVSSCGSSPTSSWEQDGVKVCLTWARLHAQQGGGSSLLAAVAPSAAGKKGVGGAALGLRGAELGDALARALAALCRFLHGFASTMAPGLTALRMLDTASIVRNLEVAARRHQAATLHRAVLCIASPAMGLIFSFSFLHSPQEKKEKTHWRCP